MKKFRLVIFLCLLISATASLKAQRVSISTNGSHPDASSILDVKSTTYGMLIPRTTTAQRMSIATPAKGLLVFDNQTNTFWFHSGSAWTQLASVGSTAGYWWANGANIYK